MEILGVKDPVSCEEELLRFVFRVYQGTGGRYPVLEWLKYKPSPNDFKGFARAYRSFLRSRLKDEFDELYILRDRDGKVVGTVALVYDSKRTEGAWWVPEQLKSKGAGLVEFLMVDPLHQGKGYGRRLLDMAVKKLKGMGLEVYVITFPHLKAYGYYLKNGFTKVMDHGEFAVLRWSGG